MVCAVELSAELPLGRNTMILIFFAILSLVISLLNFGKDYDKFTKRGRITYLFSILSLFGVLLLKEIQSKQSAQASANQISRLTAMVQSEKENHAQERKVREQSLNILYDKLSELRAKISTEQLQIELNATQEELLRTRAELGNTQKALQPPKSSSLSFSVFTEELMNKNWQNPIKQVKLPIINGVINVDVTVINTTKINANSPSFRLLLCNGCSYASEPIGWAKVSGAKDFLREARIPLLGAGIALGKTTVAVLLPSLNVNQFEIGLAYDCLNCTSEPTPQKIVIHVIHDN